MKSTAVARIAPLIVAPLVASITLTGCAKEDGTKKTFVQAQQVMQWIVDNECDRSGGVKGYPAYGGEGMGQIAQVTFVCDNSKTYDIHLMTDGTYKYTFVK